jgi:hypothetical protein
MLRERTMVRIKAFPQDGSARFTSVPCVDA